MNMLDLVREFRRVFTPKFDKFAEILDFSTLPLRALGYEVRRFFSPPVRSPASDGRAAAAVIVSIATIFAMVEFSLDPLFALAGLAVLLLSVGTANYLDALKIEISPADGDDKA